MKFLYDSSKSSSLNISRSINLVGVRITELHVKVPPPPDCGGTPLAPKLIKLVLKHNRITKEGFLLNDERSLTDPVLCLVPIKATSIEFCSVSFTDAVSSPYTVTFKSPINLDKRPMTNQWFQLELQAVSNNAPYNNLNFFAVVELLTKDLDIRRGGACVRNATKE